MNSLVGVLTGILLSLVVTVLPVTGRDQVIASRPAPEITRYVSSAVDILAHMQPFPVEARAAVDNLLALAANPRQPTFNPADEAALVNFVIRAGATDSGWKLPARDGAEGAAYVVTIAAPLQRYLQLNFNPGIPDYAVFPASLRHSSCADSQAMQAVYACINAGPTGTQKYVTGQVKGSEEITPNPESGSYFSYSNTRTFFRCKIGGRDVLFSCAETTAPSTLSNRGALVGPLDQGLFYYSEKPGLNVAGMTWMTSQIFHSTTLSVYVALNSNETAVANFAWLNAGWKGLNVTRAQHILNSQKTTLDFSRKIAEHPHITPETLSAMVSSVQGLPEAAVNAEYELYLLYVRAWRDRSKKGFFTARNLLHDLYDAKVNQGISRPYRCALLIQERVRVILGIPTWSAPGGLPGGSPLRAAK
jgi:hypothetical protein